MNSFFSNNINNKTYTQNQANPHHGTQQHNAHSSLNRQNIIQTYDANGNLFIHPADQNLSKTDANGNILYTTTDNYFIDPFGFHVHISLFAGISWTGLMTPIYRYSECKNPFTEHEPRAVCLGADGWPTKVGTIVCSQCSDKNDTLIKFKKWTLGFYNPETF